MNKIIFLYAIDDGENQYYYTNADMMIKYDTKTFLSVPISHDEVENDVDEVSKCTIKITMSNNLAYIQKVLECYDVFVTNLTLYRYYPESKTTEIEWRGVLSKLEISHTDTSCTFGNLMYETQRQGLRQVYQRLCPYALYGCQCKVNKSNYGHQFNASAFTITNDYTLTCSDQLPDNLAGGIMLLANNAYYFIKAVDYDNMSLTVSRPIYQKFLSGVIMLYDGCNRTMDMCNGHFNNSENYGGYPLLPQDNPIDINHT